MFGLDPTGELQPLLNSAIGGLLFPLVSLVSKVVDDGNSWKINYHQYRGRETQRNCSKCNAESSPPVQDSRAGGKSALVKCRGGMPET